MFLNFHALVDPYTLLSSELLNDGSLFKFFDNDFYFSMEDKPFFNEQLDSNDDNDKKQGEGVLSFSSLGKKYGVKW